MTSALGLVWLGRQSYDETSLLQEELVEKRRSGQIDDLLLLLEHPPTYTCGRRTRPGDLPQSRDWYREQGFAVCDTPRGGQVTYHGPGQLVIYPIIDLRGIGDLRGADGQSTGTGDLRVDRGQRVGAGRVDVAGFVTLLEQAMISATHQYLEESPPSGGGFIGTIEGLTGVWAGSGPDSPDLAKIGSIGLRISRGISSHGLSLNVSCDLAPFDSVTACGTEGGRATSILEFCGQAPDVREAGASVAAALAKLLDRPLIEIEPELCGIAPAGVATA